MPNSRPTSPHLGIYRWRVNMLQSTLHRLTGLFLCLGALLVAWGLVAAATSDAAWSRFVAFCGSWIGLVLLFLWTWSLLFHLVNGIQHLEGIEGKLHRSAKLNDIVQILRFLSININTIIEFIVQQECSRG